MIKTSGYLVTYTSSEKNNITKINYYLFGRISTISSKKYYYPGKLENVGYVKICNGCYFVESFIDNYNGLIELIPVEIQLNGRSIIRAKDYWNNFITINNLNVKNWN